MRGHSKYFAVAAAIVGVMAAATLLAFSEDRLAGWHLHPSLSLSQVHFVIRHSFGVDNWINGRDVPLDRFRGLSLSMLASPGPAKFAYVADAGRLICEGRFLMGAGSGNYTFVADPTFVSALQQMGYDTPDDEQLFAMLMMEIHLDFAREVRNAGLRASSQDLVALKAHGVTPEYLKGLRDGGYDNLRVEEIDQLRMHGVEPRFIQEARRLGYNFTPKELSQLQMFGVDGAYLKRLQSAGMRNLNADQIAKLHVHGVN
jgi:hypothetical protein